MSIVRVMAHLGAGKAILLGSVFYGLVDSRIQWIQFGENFATATAHPVQLSLNDFASLCDTFRDKENAIVSLPEGLASSERDWNYDFSKIPVHECTNCFTRITPSNAVKEGRKAFCPNCGLQCYTATRLDGVRDTPIPSPTQEPRKTGWGSSRRKEKPPEPTTEEILEKLEQSGARSRPMKFLLMAA